MNTVNEIRELSFEQARDRVLVGALRREIAHATSRITILREGDKGWFPNPLPWNAGELSRCQQIAHGNQAMLNMVLERMSQRAARITALIKVRRYEKEGLA